MAGKCTFCGTGELEPGFLEDLGSGAKGYTRWIAGPLETGMLGGAQRLGRRRGQVHAWRCSQCSHLELFVTLT